jgi:chorismate synthase
MKIEQDQARLVGGVRQGFALGSPIAFLVENRDWENWQGVMGTTPLAESSEVVGGLAESGNLPSAVSDGRRVTRPRPGHADLAGGLKYDRDDLRDVLERASARETAARVAAGALCKMLLAELDVIVTSHVTRIGDAALDENASPSMKTVMDCADASPVRCIDTDAEAAMIAAIDAASDSLDTLGGTFEVLAGNVPPGLGSHIQWDLKLDGRIAQALMSIPAQKGVEIGDASWSAGRPGSEVHDPIHYDHDSGEFYRPSNRAGGLEGGITTGSDIRALVHMKPLSTLRQPLPSVDIDDLEPIEAVVQRSDVCAVPAAAVVGEAMLALVVADACMEKFGGDSIGETKRNHAAYLEQLRQFPPTGP